MLTYIALDKLSGNVVDMFVSAGLSTGVAKAIMQFACTFYFVAGAPAIAEALSRLFVKNADK